MAKVHFDKFEKEGIKTDFKALSGANATLIPSRTIVTLASGAITAAGDVADIDNDTVFVLAEDCKVGDLGFVYWYIENKSNLIEE